MKAFPEFWTPQLLTEEELSDVCSWLMAWQSACISSDCIAQDFIKENEQLPSQKLKPEFKKAMTHLQSMVRHVCALRKDPKNEQLQTIIKSLRKQIETYRHRDKRKYQVDKDYLPYPEEDRD